MRGQAHDQAAPHQESCTSLEPPVVRERSAPCWCTRVIVESVDRTQSDPQLIAARLHVRQHPLPGTLLGPPVEPREYRVP